RALATDPQIILMDEPFSALDPITRSDLQDGLLTLQAQVGKSMVFVTHDIGEAIKLADQICIMDQGQIIQYDTPEAILKNPCNEFVEQFIGKNRIWDSPELIRVKDIMIEHPVTCSANFTLFECMERMRSHGVGSLVVIEGRSRKLLGMLSAGQIQSHSDRYKRAGAIMHTELVTADPDESIVDMLKTIQEKGVFNVPVVTQENDLVGMLTKSSLVSALSQQYVEEESA
ncbi:MAG: CBS domain-containing protein, partial [Enterobacteriaceae bacterium]